MLTTPTPKMISDYRENGFLVIENFLDAGELDCWRRTTEEAVAQRLQEAPRFLNNQIDPESYYARVFTQCVKLADTHTGMRELMHDERLGRVAGMLSGVDGIRLWHDQALIKPPFGNPTGWHLDNPFWSFHSRDVISIWVALDDATMGNGCLWYIPGSHKTATFDSSGIGENIGDLFKVYPEWEKIDPVPCPCPAGSAVFHNGLTAHGAGANMTNRQRRAMTCAYMPDGSTFNGLNKNVLPDDYFTSLKAGDPLNDEQISPLLWRNDWEKQSDTTSDE